jgi:hypothetical protein
LEHLKSREAPMALLIIAAALTLTACGKTNEEKFDGVVRDARRGSSAASQPAAPASALSSSSSQSKFDDVLKQARKKP